MRVSASPDRSAYIDFNQSMQRVLTPGPYLKCAWELCALMYARNQHVAVIIIIMYVHACVCVDRAGERERETLIDRQRLWPQSPEAQRVRCREGRRRAAQGDEVASGGQTRRRATRARRREREIPCKSKSLVKGNPL